MQSFRLAAVAGAVMPSTNRWTGVLAGVHPHRDRQLASADGAYATARNKVRYNGAAPMCGVMGDG